MTLKILEYNKNFETEIHESLDILKDLDKESVLWIDLESDNERDVSELAKEFNLHELAVEDALTTGHSPKIENYGKYLFLIVRTLKSSNLLDEEALAEWDGPEEEKYTRGVSIFFTENLVITHRQKEVPWLDAAFRQAKQYPSQSIADGTDSLIHRILDVLTDRFLRDLNYFEKKIDIAEDKAVNFHDDFDIATILEMKRDLGTIRQVIRDQRGIISKFASENSLISDKQQRRYFKDIDDHALAILKIIDKQIETLISVRDVYFAMSNVKLADIMRVLAVITTIAVPLNLVVGLYGMNFEAIPLLSDPNGFWLVISVMLALTGSMLFFFRKKNWL